MSPSLEDLPGSELVAAGLSDLAQGHWTRNALLVALAAPRLRDLGLTVPEEGLPEDADMELYHRLAEEDPDSAHGRYNALLRRLISFEQALEHRRSRARPTGS